VSLVVVVLLVALAVGRVAGGSLERLGTLPLRSRRLVLLAVVVQLAGVVVGGPAHPVALAVSAGLVIAFLVRNRGVRGTGLVALGLLANALVVGANGAMPVSADAAGRAGVSTQDLVAGTDPRHELAGPSTPLPWLGDVIPVPLPVRPEVVSPGDVLVAAGVAQLVVAGMLRPRRAVPPLPPVDNKGRQRRALPPLGDASVRPSSPRRLLARASWPSPASERARERAVPPRDAPS
jgi:hypothetical protein